MFDQERWGGYGDKMRRKLEHKGEKTMENRLVTLSQLCGHIILAKIKIKLIMQQQSLKRENSLKLNINLTQMDPPTLFFCYEPKFDYNPELALLSPILSWGNPSIEHPSPDWQTEQSSGENIEVSHSST